MKKLLTSALLLVAFSVQPLLSADAELVAPGLGDPGDLVKINIDTGRTVDGKVLISGRDAGQQLLINGDFIPLQLVVVVPRMLIYLIGKE